MNGADLFALSLRAQGVEWIGTLCGHGLNEVYAACLRADIKLVDVRNEQTAAYMAECWGEFEPAGWGLCGQQWGGARQCHDRGGQCPLRWGTHVVAHRGGSTEHCGFGAFSGF